MDVLGWQEKHCNSVNPWFTLYQVDGDCHVTYYPSYSLANFESEDLADRSKYFVRWAIPNNRLYLCYSFVVVRPKWVCVLRIMGIFWQVSVAQGTLPEKENICSPQKQGNKWQSSEYVSKSFPTILAPIFDYTRTLMITQCERSRAKTTLLTTHFSALPFSFAGEKLQ
jgi:hypothetical protein